MKRLIGFGFIALFLGGCDGKSQLSLMDVRLQRFESCDQMANILNDIGKRIAEREKEFPMATDPVASAGAPMSTDTTVSGETNVQVQGVDEMDTVKADGDFIYTLQSDSTSSTSNNLYVLRRSPAGSTAVVQKISLGNTFAQGLFLNSSKLVVLHNPYNTTSTPCVGMGQGSSAMPVNQCYLMAQQLAMTYFDRNADGTLTQVNTRLVDGNLQAARLIGNRLHLVINKYIGYGENTSQKISSSLPQTSLGNSSGALTQCSDIYYEPAITSDSFDEIFYSNNLVCVLSADISNSSYAPKGDCALMNGGSTIYASKQNLFVADGGWSEQTAIHRFFLEDDSNSTHYVGSALADGYLLNQFSMDEYDNHLRVATTFQQGAQTSSGCELAPCEISDSVVPSSNNKLSIFQLGDGDLKLVSELKDIGKGEQIYAVRFMEDKGYVVTYKRIDPLFTLDLKDPTHPLLRGELQIPGYSSYLHPMQDGYLLAIGKDAEAALSEPGFAWYEGMALSIFDVRDLDHPKLLHKLGIGSSGTDSEALHDHKAFRFDPVSGLLIFPIDLYEGGSQQGYLGTHTFSGFQIYSASLQDGFNLVGSSAFENLSCDYCWMQSTGRSFVNNGEVSLVGGGELVSRSVSAPNMDVSRILIQ